MNQQPLPNLDNDSEIAIIGISCRFPKAKNIAEFWQNLQEGVECISFFNSQELVCSGVDPELLNNTNYVKANSVLSDIDMFDAFFFDISAREAETIDPQHRIFLEQAWEAIENAGYDPQTYKGSIGVYAGCGINTYLLNNLYKKFDTSNPIDDYKYRLLIGNDKDFLSTRVSYQLNLKGPSITVQTACSTSLVAVHLASQSLLNGECDIALAGGVAVKVPEKTGYLYQEGMILSPDGHCRAFDIKAAGTISGSGVGLVVLKRLEDAIADGDFIHAVIKGSAINNDGAVKVGYTAPSVDGQTAVILEAQTVAGIDPETISYMEAHGTGTPLGDPIEITALTQAFSTNTQNKGFCAIGSVKTNVGHLDAAAGVAGLIKTVLALKHQQIPPSLHFESPNPKIDFANSPFYVNTKLSEWKTNGTPRRAGVSSFGIGGTNAHVVLEEAPPQQPSGKSRPYQLLTISAKTSSGLELAIANLSTHLQQHPELNLADIAYTLSKGRKAFNYRRMFVCQDIAQTQPLLSEVQPSKFHESGDRSIIFMFSGQGSQYVNMGRELYELEPTFREHIDKCAEILLPHLGVDIRHILYPNSEEIELATQQLQQTALAQPALFVVEYALAQLWMSWGIRPVAMIGHSIGEYVAGAIAGVFSLEDALAIVAIRGELMQQMPTGSMLAVPLTEQQVQPLLGQELSLAAVNTPSSCVVSGPTSAIETLQQQLAAQGIDTKPLFTSHAFHSAMMEPVVQKFTQRLQQAQLQPPQIPYISNLTGTWITADEATNPDYWAQHLRQTVRFAEGLEKLLQEPAQILLEVGPGWTLSKLTKQYPNKDSEQVVLTSLHHPRRHSPSQISPQSDLELLLNTLGDLWLNGVQVDWSGFYAHEQRCRLPLPTYPFERQRYWIEPENPSSSSTQLWKTVVQAGQHQASSGILEFDQQTCLESRQWLDRLCIAYINKTLKHNGAFSNPDDKYTFEELFEKCQVIPRYRQLFARWLQVLVEQGHLQQNGGIFTKLLPFSSESFDTVLAAVKTQCTDTPQQVDLVQLCGENLLDILTGKKPPLEFFNTLIYDEEQAQKLNIYPRWIAYYNNIMRASLEQVVKSLPSAVNLRVLEVGGGMGLATSELLPLLPAKQTNYTFTDVGGLFLKAAKKKFSDYPFIDYRLFDIEKPPEEQGYSAQSFDVIVAANVLHVTKNMEATLEYVRSLLAPGGILLLWECTEPRIDFDITWGLLMNPPEDEQRNQGNPFLSKKQWQEALISHGFIEVEAFSATEVFGHHVIVAQAATLANKTAPAAFTTTLKQEAQVSLDKKPDIADWFYIPSWKRSPLPKNSQLGVAQSDFSRYVEKQTRNLTPQPPSLQGKGENSKPLSLQERGLERGFPDSVKSQIAQSGCSLVFVDECGIGSEFVKQLALLGQDVVTIKLGKQFSKNSEAGQHLYTINPQNRDDYDALLNELRTLGLIPKTIAHLWSITPPSYSDSRLDNYEKAQEQGLYSLILLVQAIGKQNLTNELEIVVISNGMQALTGEEMLNPEKATLLGAVKVIPREYPNIRCRSIDIVLPASGSWKEEKLIEQLLNETSANTSDEIIAYRGVHRWVQTFESVRLDKDVKEIPRLKQGGVYLISGGLGYLGLELLAPHLAKTFQAKLILIGRSAFPLRQDWTKWLATHDDNDEISRKIRKVQELEKLGSEVLVASVDVANLQQMQELIAQAQGQFGQINGVIHTAGILGDSSIQRKTIDQVKSVLEAKVKGTLVLDILFKDAELDFLILCSSMAAIAPLPGQVAYTSANNFIDSFAHYKTSTDKQFTVSINLYGWQEGGMGFEGTKHIQKIFQAQSKAVSHPLIDSSLIKDSNQEIYISHLSASKHWVLNEHKLMGKATLPGTAYLELAVAACENHTQNRTIELREVTFFKPLVVEEHTEKEVRTLLNKQEYGFEFVIVSRVDSTIEKWTEHARGEIVWTQPESPKKYAISEILDNCHQQEIIVSEVNYQTQSENLEFGLRWQNLQQINFGNNQGLALLELSKSFIDDLNNYKLHPALLDAATGFLTRQLSNKNHYLPFSYKRLTIHKSIASRVYSYARLVEKTNSEQDTLSFNISILDIEGNELVEIEEYTLKKINPEIEQSQVSREIMPAISESENFQLRIFSPGVLETLKFQPTTRKKPKPDQVEIEVAAVGLNFQEVLVAMGLFPTPTDFVYEFGLECAGKIASLGEGVKGFEIGDEVIAIGSSSLSRFMTTTANLVALKPKHLTLQEAATIPVAFGTAYYSLMKVGRLCKGESILIHSAAGGVGMAAVEIAQWVGAEIFATAGNAEKREFLRSKGIKHVMDSRSVAFADEVMRLTDGKGVNVVLNSLGGEFIPKSLAILARNGRFLEIGQKDILNNTQLGLRPFEKNLSFFAIHPDMEDFKHIDWCREVVEFFEQGNFPNLPHRVFPITKVADAFEYMAGGKHIGKIVVSLQERESLKTLVSKEIKVELTATKTAPFLAKTNSNSVDLLPLNNKLNTDFFREDGLSPSETIEIFNRILGSTLPQVLIWTNDFLSWRERHNTYNQENLIEIFEKANLPQATQNTYSRPKLKNEYVAPKNEIEQTIAEVWQEVLGINEVGRYDNFFELGGDSLLIVQVRSKLQKRLNINFSINDAFEYSTISALAQYLSKDQTQELVSQPINERAEKLQKAIAQDAQMIEKRRKARE